MTHELITQLAVVIPLIGALFMWVSHNQPNLREAVTIVTAGLLFVSVASLLPAVLTGARPSAVLAEPLPNLPLALEVEPLGMLFAVVASFLWIVTSVYSIGYMRGNHERHQTRYYIYFAIALSSTMGVAFAGNMLTLFVFYEILTLSTYPLVTHHGTDEAMRAGRTYLGLLLFTSIGLQLLAILWTWQVAGTLDFAAGGILNGKASNTMMGVLLILYVLGIGKAAIMPLHRWLPAAMVAPTPVSALLHAVAVVKAGVFTVAKVLVYVFGLDLLRALNASALVVYLAGFTIIAASIIALKQDNLKRLLAYSTISQLSYIVMAAAVLAPLSVVGAALHIAAHAFGKITLFFAAGSIYTATHKTEISQLDGIGRSMPWTMGAFTIGALSMVGVPPAAGFISKWYMLLGALEVENVFAVGVIVVSTLLNAAYFLPIVYTGFFRTSKKEPSHSRTLVREAPLPIVMALTISALLTVLFFCFPDVPLTLAYQLIGDSP
ncbi:MAG: monovalent cation/H+ antiporter subunit D family protein [Nitrospiraceae bacterium]